MKVMGSAFLMALSLVALSGIADAQTISFQSADYAGWRDVIAKKPETTVTLKASWTFPSGAAAGRLPAVVLMHGASGIGGGERLAQRHFAAAGYAVLMVDRFSRGSNAGDRPWTASADALNALKAAAGDPRIDPARIAIVGISSGGVPAIGAGFLWLRRAVIGLEPSYAAHVGFYPNCLWATFGAGGSRPPAPMLLLMAGKDDNAPARMCQDMIELHRVTNTPSRITIKVYEGAPHAFLNNESTGVRLDTKKQDLSRCPLSVIAQGLNGIFRDGKAVPLTPQEKSDEMARCTKYGALMGYDADAARAALADAAAFLAEHLGAAR